MEQHSQTSWLEITSEAAYSPLMKSLRYLFVIEKAVKNYSGYFPDVPGCVTTARTIEKMLANGAEALDLHFEDEAKLPRPRTLAWHLDKGGLKLRPTDVVTWIEHDRQHQLAAA